VNSPRFAELTSDLIRAEAGMRFLTDPSFEVRVNGRIVEVEDIGAPHIER